MKARIIKDSLNKNSIQFWKDWKAVYYVTQHENSKVNMGNAQAKKICNGFANYFEKCFVNSWGK